MLKIYDYIMMGYDRPGYVRFVYQKWEYMNSVYQWSQLNCYKLDYLWTWRYKNDLHS